jgi:hypothetical protein
LSRKTKAKIASRPPTTSVKAMFRNISSELVLFSNLEIIAITRVFAERLKIKDEKNK